MAGSQIGRAEARTRWNLRAEQLVLVVVANLIPYKGHADLLEALARAAELLPRCWCLLVVGRDDGYGAALRSQAAHLGLDAHIRWLGSVEALDSILAAADIGIQPSHEEGFSNAILEGMAAGLAMVVTDVGGNPEAAVQGQSGLVVPPRDPAALATALLQLAASIELRGQLGAAATVRATACFGLPRCVAAYAAIYQQVLAQAPTSY